MEMLQLRCPNCNAVLELDDSIGTTCFCMHCGTKILLDGQDKNVLDAKLRMQELNNEKLKIEKEYEEKDKKREEEKQNNKAAWLTIGVSLGLLLLIAAVILIFNTPISVPYSSTTLCSMNIDECVSVLESAGYKNISVQKLDRRTDADYSRVKSISIDGDTFFFSGKEFGKRAKIIITYYG